MSSKIEVSRELLSHAVTLLSSVHSDVAHQLTALLAAPVVKRQPDAFAWVVVSPDGKEFSELQSSEDAAKDLAHDMDGDLHPDHTGGRHEIKSVFTVPPELAELQATIARLKAGNERLKDGQGEPVAYADPKSFENFKNLAHLGGLYAHEWMWANPAPGLKPLYTSQPAPVSVVLPLREMFHGEMDNPEIDFNKGWNACLDKVKELNQ